MLTEKQLRVLAPSPYRTSGERLLHFLRTYVLDDLHGRDITTIVADSTAVALRDHHFVSALQDLVSVNVLRRLLLSARWALDRWGTGINPDAGLDPRLENYVRSAVVNELLVDYRYVTPIYHYLMPAAENSLSKPSKELRNEIFSRHGLICYSCGIALKLRSADPTERATVEHIWPLSLGGDSDFGNLLPACDACNSNRGNLPVWSSFWFQACFLGPRPSERAIDRMLGTKTRLALQFFRIYSHSQRSGASLKRSSIELGPLVLPDLSQRTFSSDFFTILSYEQLVTP